MNPDYIDLDILIQQHGEAAKAYANRAFLLGNTYVIENFYFDVAVQENLEKLIGHRQSGMGGIVDIKLFAKPDNSGFGRQQLSEDDAFDLFSFCKYVYPKDYNYCDPPEWWTLSDICNGFEQLDRIDFAVWMEDKIRPADLEVDALNEWLSRIQPWLGHDITLYHMEDEFDSNCGFAPYVFIGDKCVIVVAERWVL